jgi:CBS domain-containing protein
MIRNFKNILPKTSRFMSSTAKDIQAFQIYNNSCYHKIDYKVNEESAIQEALSKFSAFNVGCLAVTNKDSKVVGIISERDYISKVASKGVHDNNLKIKDICTYGPNIIVARKNDSLDTCMQKMMFKDIRHLLIIDDKDEEFIGIISIKDLIKEIQKQNDEVIMRLSDFRIGKGAYFGSE